MHAKFLLFKLYTVTPDFLYTVIPIFEPFIKTFPLNQGKKPLFNVFDPVKLIYLSLSILTY